MSIIFDALKRADALRQKGQAPTLATRVATAKTPVNTRIWVLVAVFILMGASAWWLRPKPETDRAVVAIDGATTPPSAQPNTASRVVSAPAETPSTPDLTLFPVSPPGETLTNTPAQGQTAVVPTDLTARTVSAAPLTMPMLDTPLTGAAQFQSDNAKPNSAPRVAAQPANVPAVSTPAIVPSVPAVPVESTDIVSGVTAQAPIPAQTPSDTQPSAASGLPSVFELEYQVRHELPKMAVSMYVYNAKPQFRFVIIGGKRIAEGEQIESKVTIAQIRADGLECDFQGTRFFYPRQSL